MKRQVRVQFIGDRELCKECLAEVLYQMGQVSFTCFNRTELIDLLLRYNYQTEQVYQLLNREVFDYDWLKVLVSWMTNDLYIPPLELYEPEELSE